MRTERFTLRYPAPIEDAGLTFKIITKTATAETIKTWRKGSHLANKSFNRYLLEDVIAPQAQALNMPVHHFIEKNWRAVERFETFPKKRIINANVLQDFGTETYVVMDTFKTRQNTKARFETIKKIGHSAIFLAEGNKNIKKLVEDISTQNEMIARASRIDDTNNIKLMATRIGELVAEELRDAHGQSGSLVTNNLSVINVGPVAGAFKSLFELLKSWRETPKKDDVPLRVGLFQSFKTGLKGVSMLSARGLGATVAAVAVASVLYGGLNIANQHINEVIPSGTNIVSMASTVAGSIKTEIMGVEFSYVNESKPDTTTAQSPSPQERIHVLVSALGPAAAENVIKTEIVEKILGGNSAQMDHAIELSDAWAQYQKIESMKVVQTLDAPNSAIK